jgi:23S rRNA (guanosine2251-2'-O)-methyltransferase
LRTVCGINPVKEVLRVRPEQVREVILLAQSAAARELTRLCERAGVAWRAAGREELERLARGAVHQGALAQVSDFRYWELGDLVDPAGTQGHPPLLLVLDGIEDPHNLGAIVRSAQALGADGVILPKDRAAGVTPAVAKAASGAVETVRIAQVTNLSRSLEELKGLGFWTAALHQGAEKPIWEIDLTVPLALVIGSEGKGVRPLVRSHCDLALRIPIEGPVGSLNASVAAGIALYEVARQRQRLIAAKPSPGLS